MAADFSNLKSILIMRRCLQGTAKFYLLFEKRRRPQGTAKFYIQVKNGGALRAPPTAAVAGAPPVHTPIGGALRAPPHYQCIAGNSKVMFKNQIIYLSLFLSLSPNISLNS